MKIIRYRYFVSYSGFTDDGLDVVGNCFFVVDKRIQEFRHIEQVQKYIAEKSDRLNNVFVHNYKFQGFEFNIRSKFFEVWESIKSYKY